MQSHSLHVLGHDREVASAGAYRGIAHAVSSIVRTEGVRALYKGLLVSWLGATHSAIQFPLYEHLKARLEREGEREAAEAKARRAADPAPAAPPAPAALPAPISAPPLPTLGADIFEVDLIAWDADSLSPGARVMRRAEASGDGGAATAPSPLSSASVRLVVASSISKVAASLLTDPHEVIRARLQDQRSTSPRAYAGIVDCARTILRDEGLAGLYSGFSANLARALPATAVMFVVYEFVLRTLRESAVLDRWFRER
jgi:hypothetical protein